MINAYKNKQDLYATVASIVYNNGYWDNMEHFEDGTPNPEGKKRRSFMKSVVLGRRNVMPPYKEIYIENNVNCDYKQVCIA